MNKADAIDLIARTELKTGLNSIELAEVETMLQTKGWTLFAGLLLGSRQALLMAIANMQLGTAEKSCQASVLQGKVHGIDLALETIVELFTPAEKEIN